MGSYLSQPVVAKESFDDSFDQLEFGVSGMQGWRMSMEDAHCCLSNFDEKNSCMFGVFDGHGGKEVAEYCAKRFHEFLMDTDAFREGDIKKALKEAYMNIDEAITSEEVIKELKVIGGIENNDEEDEAAMLLEEANMPIEDLLERLKSRAQEQLNSGEEKSLEYAAEEEKVTNGLSTLVENGDCENTNSSRSRKQKKPIKRNLNEIVTDVALPSTVDSGEQELSITGVAMNITAASGDTSSKSSENPTSAGSSNLSDTKADEEDDDFDPEYQVEDEDDDDEDGDIDDDDDEDEDDESDSEEEFEDSEGVDFQQGTDEVGKDSGTTAIVAIVQNNKLYVANVGDSRCVLCRNSSSMELSADHKPEDAAELSRIEKAGAKVTAEGRVNGGLNLSRAIGDHVYKQNKSVPPEEQAITAYPDVTEVELTKDDRFMVLACDGIWNVMTSEEVIQFVKERLDSETEEKPSLSKICEEMFDFCLAPDTKNDGSGCDNMTCMIVQFKNKDGNSSISVGEKRLNTSTEDTNSKSKKVKLGQD